MIVRAAEAFAGELGLAPFAQGAERDASCFELLGCSTVRIRLGTSLEFTKLVAELGIEDQGDTWQSSRCGWLVVTVKVPPELRGEFVAKRCRVTSRISAACSASAASSSSCSHRSNGTTTPSALPSSPKISGSA